MRLLIMLAVAGLALAPVGCTKKVSYGDPTQVETVTVDFGSTDLQTIASKMVQSLLVHPVVAEGSRPVLYVGRVKNKTSEHIDTKSVTDKIRTTLLNSGKVQFTATSDIPQELVDQLEYQTASGLVNPASARKFGHQVGADYMLVGEISSIRKKDGSTKDVYYKITLNLVDIETALLVWADEKEIRKGETKSLFGG